MEHGFTAEARSGGHAVEAADEDLFADDLFAETEEIPAAVELPAEEPAPAADEDLFAEMEVPAVEEPAPAEDIADEAFGDDLSQMFADVEDEVAAEVAEDVPEVAEVVEEVVEEPAPEPVKVEKKAEKKAKKAEKKAEKEVKAKAKEEPIPALKPRLSEPKQDKKPAPAGDLYAPVIW